MREAGNGVEDAGEEDHWLEDEGGDDREEFEVFAPHAEDDADHAVDEAGEEERGRELEWVEQLHAWYEPNGDEDGNCERYYASS